MPTLDEMRSAASLVYAHMTPTAQICWPLLSARAGCEVWVKHENHAPTGAFKVRGGLVYLSWMRESHPGTRGVIVATRGNHGQSIALAARTFGLNATVVVPHGNSVEKNAAMKAYGAELIEHGDDFQAALEHARVLADERGLWLVESFHPLLIRGVATYGLELFTARDDLDAVYVPIGLGSGVCGVIAARDALDRRTDVIGVVADNAPAYQLSFERKEPVETESADTFADGIACRTPASEAVKLINRGVSRVVSVSEEAIAAAIRHYYTDTHNVAEGAGAAPLAALLEERDRMSGKRVGLVLSGGNIDQSAYMTVLSGRLPVSQAHQSSGATTSER